MFAMRFSKNQELILPMALDKTLGLREGGRVELQRQDDALLARVLSTLTGL